MSCSWLIPILFYMKREMRPCGSFMQMYSWCGRAARATSLAGIFVASKQSEKSSCPIQVLQPEKRNSDFLLSRKVINHLDKSSLNLRLYQYETCPFCCKVRSFLDYYGFSYEVVEVNPVTRSQIKFSSDYKKVPILRCFNEVNLTESSLIISQLATFLHRPERKLQEILAMYQVLESTDDKGRPVRKYPNKYFIMMEQISDSRQMANGKEEREWREWIDEYFIHLISPNVYRTWGEAIESFKWFEQVGDWQRLFPFWERILAVYIGAVAMFLLSKMLKWRHKIDDERKAMHAACEEWMDAIGPNRLFMGGDSPNLADISLYGAMNSFVGCSAFKEVIAKGRIAEWHNRMKKAVERHEGRALLEQRV